MFLYFNVWEGWGASCWKSATGLAHCYSGPAFHMKESNVYNVLQDVYNNVQCNTIWWGRARADILYNNTSHQSFPWHFQILTMLQLYHLYTHILLNMFTPAETVIRANIFIFNNLGRKVCFIHKLRQSKVKFT